jgi:hypothetical protein
MKKLMLTIALALAVVATGGAAVLTVNPTPAVAGCGGNSGC